MMTGLIVVAVVLLASSAFALWRKRTDGRFREYAVAPASRRPVEVGSATTSATGSESWSGPGSDPADGSLPIAGADLGPGSGAGAADRTGTEILRAEQLDGRELGRQATLVQFSSAFCQPCRVAKTILASVAASAEGVRHIEIDAESHLDLVREIGIMRTPTTLVLDAEGRITARATGVPRKDQVLAAIGRTLPA